MQPQALAIETISLTKQFGRHRAVDTLNLAIHSGSVFGFLGPNGAGKTTTIRMFLGLIRPTSGGGRILGHDIMREQVAILPHIGAIVESPAFYLSLSGRDNLRVLARTAGREDSRAIARVLETVGLSARAHDRVKTYSLGMKQRLAIAAALLNSPQIIFLDEPTNGLDPAGTVEIRELIGQLGASGHTIFLSSHLLHEVEQVCTEVAIINHGKLVTQGRVADLLSKDRSLLVEAEPLSTLQEMAARFGVQAQIQGPRLMKMALSSERAPDLVTALASAGAKVYQVTPQHASLEHLFLELTDDASGTNGQHETRVATTTERTHQALVPLVAGSFAIMGAVIGRSSVAGIVAGIVWFLADELLSAVFQPASLSVALHVLQTQINGVAMPSLSMIIASLTVAFYLIVPVAVAAFIFRQRDMVGVG